MLGTRYRYCILRKFSLELLRLSWLVTIIRHLSVCKIIKVYFSSHIEIFQKLNLRRDTRNIELSELSATVESASEEGEIN